MPCYATSKMSYAKYKQNTTENNIIIGLKEF